MQFLLLSGDRHTVTISSKELAQEIGGHLHGVIGVKGVATWDIDTWSLADFVAQEISDYKHEKYADPVEAINALAVAAGDFWDEVDPDEYVNELRSD